MNDLEALFENDSSPHRPPVASHSDTVDELARLVGPQSPSSGERRVFRDVEALASKIGGPGPIVQPRPAGWSAPETAVAGNRPLNLMGAAGRISLLSVVVAVLAIAGVVAAVSLGIYRQLTADPVDAAMASLVEAETEVQNDLKGFATAADLYTQTADQADSLVAAANQTLPKLEGKVEQGVLSAAVGARDALAGAVTPRADVEVPVYDRGAIDATSVAAIASATDKARAQRMDIPDRLSGVRTARSEVIQAISEFTARLDAVGQRVASDVAQELERNDVASDEALDKVSAAAGLVGQTAGADLIAPLDAYAVAVDELRSDTQLILSETTIPRTTPPRTVTPTASASPAPAPSESPTVDTVTPSPEQPSDVATPTPTLGVP